jgi:hypothetical protein
MVAMPLIKPNSAGIDISDKTVPGDAGRECFNVYLVSSKHAVIQPGRNTEKDGSRRIQKMHGCRFLKSSYLPHEQDNL